MQSINVRAGRLIASSRFRLIPPMRLFHQSSRRSATAAPPPTPTPPPPSDPSSNADVQALVEKIRNHTGATEAMYNLKNVFEGKGLDMTKPPSPFQLMRLVADKEVRGAIQTLVTEFQKAGVEVNMQNMQAMFAKLQAPPP
ncbi:hypothetical protein BCR39DRAFT_538143 [Naematelia encephala]|uniref:Uncharacterized protein n=1 Tax=Naematelia encephala TaxID=71784 RepID=A0A1Y2AYD2_9TREE|nr:hypothetical protein BCR39DRAFT_538143 [Naematelia encephala]